MNAKELRIGNLVTVADKEAIWEVYAVERFVRVIDLEGNKEFIPYRDLRPINLSHEWLERMGFQKLYMEDGDFFYELDLFGPDSKLTLIEGDKNGMVEVCLSFSENEVRFQYVHQVQNFYRAVTGKELKISVQKEVESCQ